MAFHSLLNILILTYQASVQKSQKPNIVSITDFEENFIMTDFEHLKIKNAHYFPIRIFFSIFH